jgi:hypothetical protein
MSLYSIKLSVTPGVLFVGSLFARLVVLDMESHRSACTAVVDPSISQYYMLYLHPDGRTYETADR